MNDSNTTAAQIVHDPGVSKPGLLPCPWRVPSTTELEEYTLGLRHELEEKLNRINLERSDIDTRGGELLIMDSQDQVEAWTRLRDHRLPLPRSPRIPEKRRAKEESHQEAEEVK